MFSLLVLAKKKIAKLSIYKMVTAVAKSDQLHYQSECWMMQNKLCRANFMYCINVFWKRKLNQGSYWHANEEIISFFKNFSLKGGIKKANQVLVVPSNVLMQAFPPTEQL